jgi:REP element-mobilizing transposase RayT
MAVQIAWHITTATHNSRYSQRMFDNHVKVGEAIWLSEKEERIISETIANIAEKDNLKILAYNICGNHMHLLLICEENKLPKIVQKIKSISARKCNIAMGRTIASAIGKSEATTTREHAPLSERKTSRGKAQAHLWTQKYGSNPIKNEKQLYNTIAYIQNNRQKHELPEYNWLKPLCDKMCSSYM